MTDTNLITITGLWENKSKDGELYFSGALGNAKIMIFRNKNKKKETHPDWNLCIAPRPEKQEHKHGRGSPPPIQQAQVEKHLTDDIPF